MLGIYALFVGASAAYLTGALPLPVAMLLNAVAVYVAASLWYAHEQKLSEVFLPPWDTSLPALLGSGCDPGASIDAIPESLDEVFTPTLLAAAASETLVTYGVPGCMAAESGLTTTSVARIQADDPTYGVHMVFGEEDGLLHAPIEREAWATLCAEGPPLSFVECAGSNHIEPTFATCDQTLVFFAARFAGVPFAKPASCAVPAPQTCAPDG